MFLKVDLTVQEKYTVFGPWGFSACLPQKINVLFFVLLNLNL